MQGRSVGKDLLDKVLQECAITSADRLYFSLATQEDSYLVSSWECVVLHRAMCGAQPNNTGARRCQFSNEHMVQLGTFLLL